MGVQISYMGTKRRISHVVSKIIRDLPTGPVLDAFSGMCAVGCAIAPDRQVWTNEIQKFPYLVANQLFCSKSGPISPEGLEAVLEKHYKRNITALKRRFKRELRLESKYFNTQKIFDILRGSEEIPYVSTSEHLESQRKRLAKKPDTFPYRLATITFAGTYFGVFQCMEIDSLRYAIDKSCRNGTLSDEQRKWAIVALGQALGRISNSTGHYAQYLRPTTRNAHRVLEKRFKSFYFEFFEAFKAVSPLGTKKWRKGNRSFNSDALDLLSNAQRFRIRPVIVYADPPYSAAQYSRYYHILETILEYRYPPTTSVGRYPDKRYQTPFSLTASVSDCLNKLIEYTSHLDASLVLSYPENGIFCRQGGNPLELLRRHYRNVSIRFECTLAHSTFGGPRAKPTIDVVEKIYVAYN